MASYVNRYTDNSDFLLASAVYDNPELTTPSADGFYQKNGIYRQQQGGVLINGSSTCPSCAGNFEVLKVNSISANELCCVSSSSFTAHFNTGDSFFIYLEHFLCLIFSFFLLRSLKLIIGRL